MKIRGRVGAHLEGDSDNKVNFEDVEDLCKMLEEKDQRLYQDLMAIRDTFNNERISRTGFKADADNVSSILIDQINSKTHNDLALDKDGLER